ncbi:MAG: universal stress protein [Chitinophagaceae bacterium]
MSSILVPFDFSENATRALQQAFFLADATGADLEVLHITNVNVAREYPKSWGEEGIGETQLYAHLEAIVKENKSTDGVEITITVKESTLVSGGIISYLLDTRPTLAVMGTHGWSGLADKLLGSNTSSLITHAIFPVLAVPPHWEPAPLTKGIANVELKNLGALLPTLEQWAAFLHTPVEVIEFSAVPEVEEDAPVTPAPGSNVVISGVVKLIDDLTLAENIAQYTSAQEGAYAIMFVHERKWFEKIFSGSISEKVSGIIEAPLLALPLS